MTETEKIIFSNIKLLESKSEKTKGETIPSFNVIFKGPDGSEIASRGWRVMGNMIHPPSIIRGNKQAPMQIVNISEDWGREIYNFVKGEGIELVPDFDDALVMATLDKRLRHRFLAI